MFPIDPHVSYRLFYPQVPIIICSKQERDVAGMPASSCIPVSNSPPLVAVGIKTGLRTGEILVKSRLLSLNWVSYESKTTHSLILKLTNPSEEKREKKMWERNPKGFDKLRRFGIRYHLVAGAPVLSEAVAYAVCSIQKFVRTGDHNLFIAEVKQAKATNDFGSDQFWRFKKYRPMLYIGSVKGRRQLTTIRARFR